ncbi:hypothetical protein CBM2626_B150332 [Cupriavidus taiwanensis]|uniref:hypothetical protein n=1 Tax=Cupriavidus taiwanensis TaxID=164546 RepID=UPI000E12BF41|nr:hypothetical protein [Cupriavidus taiwanensis]SPA02612.1 hypothetical protein CBM2626_B150332 [Cupriavidus taiwanensis]
MLALQGHPAKYVRKLLRPVESARTDVFIDNRGDGFHRSPDDGEYQPLRQGQAYYGF